MGECGSLAVFPTIDPAGVGVDEERLADLVRFVQDEVAAGTVPGAALVATRHGQRFLSLFCGTGRTADGHAIDLHPQVRLPLFSFSKGISATVAVMAWQNGRIEWDLPVRAYLPEFDRADHAAMTLRHLLTHAAGIPTVEAASVATEPQWRAWVETVASTPGEWPPGSRTAYHGLSGLFVVAETVRRVWGMTSWDALCRERLFTPLGAAGFTFETPERDQNLILPSAYFPHLDVWRAHETGQH